MGWSCSSKIPTIVMHHDMAIFLLSNVERFAGGLSSFNPLPSDFSGLRCFANLLSLLVVVSDHVAVAHGPYCNTASEADNSNIVRSTLLSFRNAGQRHHEASVTASPIGEAVFWGDERLSLSFLEVDPLTPWRCTWQVANQPFPLRANTQSKRRRLPVVSFEEVLW